MRLQSTMHANPRSWGSESERALIGKGETERLNGDVKMDLE
jgi:hypothetical protein